MKKNVQGKKLTLGRDTLRTLNSDEAKQADGAGVSGGFNCNLPPASKSPACHPVTLTV